MQDEEEGGDIACLTAVSVINKVSTEASALLINSVNMPVTTDPSACETIPKSRCFELMLRDSSIRNVRVVTIGFFGTESMIKWMIK
jgi:hypothetical protein